jgi:hypothetical protein
MGLHPTFHVGLLKPYLRDSRFDRDAPSPRPDIFEDGHEEWEVEAIVDHRPASRGREPSYLVKGVGFPSHENSWLPARQVGNAKAFVQVISPVSSRANRPVHVADVAVTTAEGYKGRIVTNSIQAFSKIDAEMTCCKQYTGVQKIDTARTSFKSKVSRLL